MLCAARVVSVLAFITSPISSESLATQQRPAASATRSAGRSVAVTAAPSSRDASAFAAAARAGLDRLRRPRRRPGAQDAHGLSRRARGVHAQGRADALTPVEHAQIIGILHLRRRLGGEGLRRRASRRGGGGGALAAADGGARDGPLADAQQRDAHVADERGVRGFRLRRVRQERAPEPHPGARRDAQKRAVRLREVPQRQRLGDERRRRAKRLGNDRVGSGGKSEPGLARPAGHSARRSGRSPPSPPSLTPPGRREPLARRGSLRGSLRGFARHLGLGGFFFLGLLEHVRERVNHRGLGEFRAGNQRPGNAKTLQLLRDERAVRDDVALVVAQGRDGRGGRLLRLVSGFLGARGVFARAARRRLGVLALELRGRGVGGD